MNPWTFIGWVVAGFVGMALLFGLLILLCAIYVATTKVIRRQILHRRTRNIPPKGGQIWNQDGSLLYITNEFDNGNIGISTAPKYSSQTHASWGEDRKNWEKRVLNRKLFLVGYEKEGA